MLPSHDQLRDAMRRMQTYALEEKLARGELTKMAEVIAREELNRRLREGEPSQAEAASDSTDSEIPANLSTSVQDQTGWSIRAWAVAFVTAAIIVLAFGSTARNKADQTFLYGVILVQSTVLTALFRLVASVFGSESSMSAGTKVLAAVGMCFALFLLTLCSAMSQSGWRGG